MDRNYLVTISYSEQTVIMALTDEAGSREYTMSLESARLLSHKLDAVLDQIIDEHGKKLPIIAVSCVSGQH